MELRTINEDNYEECLNLHTVFMDVDFVDTVAWSLAEAWVLYDGARPFAIYADDVMVGYVLMYIDNNNPQIINFLIDDRFQKRGYGSAAAKLCIDYLCEQYNASRISLPVNVNNKAAQNFWLNIGFELTDDLENGNLYMRLYIQENGLG